MVEFPSTKVRCQINWCTIFNRNLLQVLNELDWYKSKTPSFGPCGTFDGSNDQMMTFPTGQANPAKVSWV